MPDKLKNWAKMCNFELDFDHIRPWTIKDHGLGHKDYCHIDALRYAIEYEGKWIGEKSMNRIEIGDFVRPIDGRNDEAWVVTWINDERRQCRVTLLTEEDGTLVNLIRFVGKESIVRGYDQVHNRHWRYLTIHSYVAGEAIPCWKSLTTGDKAVYDNYILLNSPTFKNKESIMDINDIKEVIFNDPATVVYWKDGSKTVVQCQDGEPFDPEKGLAMAISRKVFGNKWDYYHVFRKFLKKQLALKEMPDTLYFDNQPVTIKSSQADSETGMVTIKCTAEEAKRIQKMAYKWKKEEKKKK